MTTPAVRLLWAALILGLLGASLPASLAHAEGTERRRALFEAMRERTSGADDRATFQHADPGTDCHTDPRDDTEGVPDGRGDITGWCAYIGDDEIRVAMELVINTVPAQDPNWDGLTAAVWGFDLNNDAEPDYMAILALIEDQLYFEIADENAETVCTAREQRVDTQVYEASFAADCLDGAEAAGVQAVMLYDSSNSTGEDFSLTADGAPDDGMLRMSRHTHGVSTPSPTPTPSPTQTSTGSRGTSRLSGATRVHTAIAISQRAFPSGADVVYLANQNMTPDALVAGALTDGPILLLPSCGIMPEEVLAEIRRLGARQVIALGGVNAVCDATLAAAAAA